MSFPFLKATFPLPKDSFSPLPFSPLRLAFSCIFPFFLFRCPIPSREEHNSRLSPSSVHAYDDESSPHLNPPSPPPPRSSGRLGLTYSFPILSSNSVNFASLSQNRDLLPQFFHDPFPFSSHMQPDVVSWTFLFSIAGNSVMLLARPSPFLSCFSAVSVSLGAPLGLIGSHITDSRPNLSQGFGIHSPSIFLSLTVVPPPFVRPKSRFWRRPHLFRSLTRTLFLTDLPSVFLLDFAPNSSSPYLLTISCSCRFFGGPGVTGVFQAHVRRAANLYLVAPGVSFFVLWGGPKRSNPRSGSRTRSPLRTAPLLRFKPPIRAFSSLRVQYSYHFFLIYGNATLLSIEVPFPPLHESL